MKYQVSAQGETTEVSSQLSPISVSQQTANVESRHPNVEEIAAENPKRKKRIEVIDLARGFAVALMILSHGVKGLLTFDQMPAWGLVPIHLITKFSSTLFILVFGISLAVAHMPYVGTAEWPKKRKHLWLRGLLVLFWYKVLTIVEMTPLYSREDIIKTLLYQAFPVYVEILGFYALALLWVPLILPLWKKSWWTVKLAIPILCAWASYYLFNNFDFWGNDTLKAILVEHDKHYTWGQLARAPLIFGGLILGEWLFRDYWRLMGRLKAATYVGVGALLLFGAFFLYVGPNATDITNEFFALAKNEGKHPPELSFLLFSMGGALALISISLFGGEFFARILRPITTIGSDSLQSFIFHIFVIFVFYRYLFNYFHRISYERALVLTLVLMGMTAAWIKLNRWVHEKS